MFNEETDNDLTEWQRYEADERGESIACDFTRDADYAARQIEADLQGIPR
jgi:hypothetical protein